MKPGYESEKFLSRVVWSEGMYLGPQHFQAQSRYFEDSVRFAIEHAWFEPWGLNSYELDNNVIANGIVRVKNARGIFEDGLAFETSKDGDPPPDEISIQDRFPPSADSMVVFLAVPRRKQGHANCALNGEANGVRYRSMTRSFRDLNTGNDGKPVQLCVKNLQIISDGEVRDDLLTIPLARVKHRATGGFEYDSGFVPPCTKLKTSKWLEKFLEQLIEILEAKRNTLMLPRQAGRLAGMSQLEVSNFWLLHCINSGLGALKHLHAMRSAHPEELFRELLRIAGALCTFSLRSDPASLPAYNHRELARCFSALDEHIRAHLTLVVPNNTVLIPLTSAEHPNFYSGEITDKRCFGRARWILGIGSSVGEAAVMIRTPRLVKIGSRKFVPELVRRAMPGLALIHLPAPPITPQVDLQYFSISMAGPLWDHICKTEEIGIYVPDELPNARLELQVIVGN